jgi:hypothetical protein
MMVTASLVESKRYFNGQGEWLDSRDADTDNQIDHQYDLGLETTDLDL